MFKFFRTALALSCCVVVLGGQAAQGVTAPASASAFQQVSTDAKVGMTEYRLKSNGLTVLLAERHFSPVVTVMVVYRVGSRNEAVGFTGSTHFLEHMMFKGTTKHDPQKGTGIDDVLKQVGGINNATTFYDRTYYYEIAPSSSLSSCLELEADRMRHALLRQEDRNSEMTVVRNELEMGENFAASLLDTQVFATAFREHPYHHPVIGWRSDVEGVPTERLRQFYNEFYYPDNATLIVIGDFKTDDALKSIASNFSSVPKSPKPYPKVYTVEPPQQGERRFTVQRGQEMPKVLMGFHIPNAVDKDTYPLEILASVLGDQRRQSSRLYKALVDKGLASEASAANYSLRDPGLFTVFASATSGTSLDSLEKSIKDELKKLGQEKVSDSELARAKNAVWKKMKLQAADPMGAAEQLGEAIAVADWKWWVNLEKNMKAVTADDVQRVAAKYFTLNNTTVGNYIPKEKPPEQEAKAEAADAAKPTTDEKKSDGVSPLYAVPAADGNLEALDKRTGGSATSRAPMTSAAAVAEVRASIGSRVQKKELPNGMRVLAMKIPGSGVVSLSAKIVAGDTCRSQDKTLVPELVSEMLNKGTKRYSKEQIADQLELFGANLSPGCGSYWVEFGSDVVREDFEKYLDLAGSVLQEPLLEQQELDKARKVKEAELQEAQADTGSVAMNVLSRKLYSPQSVYYEKPFADQLTELKGVTDKDLSDFHKRYYNPANVVISVVGDIEPADAFAAVEKTFSSWSKGDKTELADHGGVLPAGQDVVVTTIPDKSSVNMVYAHAVDMSMKSPEFYAFQLANSALGHDTIASRLAEVREKHGLTYGIHSSLLDNARPNSPWAIELSVNPENVKKAAALVDRICSDYQKGGITPAELATEKNRLAGEYMVVRLRTGKSIAESLTRYEMIGVPSSFMDNYAANLNKVTQAEVNQVLRKYMNINKGTVESLAGTISSQELKAGSKKGR